MSSQPMTLTQMILFQKRSLSNEMASMQQKRQSWGSNLTASTKMLWLEEAKRAYLLTVLHGWIRSSKSGMMGIPFKDFESVIAKVRHTFTAIPAGCGLLTPCNKMLQTKPPLVFLQRNPILLAAIMGHCSKNPLIPPHGVARW
jgi:hypothetical protein